ncbi:hypothetical protein Agabi119p4_8420 [Agaricus bisporus var. burnettii]|uniref:SAP domain-containing protein n=1 Tax=Agaricus bisporus var. burnettii TaxID=192524 RepID=A0A8H7C7X5_AGABI|nr:hypothetical protein Agabi119p4_8420 [Agaricus bisporus var. burnettii]
MPRVPEFPNQPLTQLNKNSLVNLARHLNIQTEGTVLALRARIRDHLNRNLYLLDDARFNRLIPNRHRQFQPGPPSQQGSEPSQGGSTDVDDAAFPIWDGIQQARSSPSTTTIPSTARSPSPHTPPQSPQQRQYPQSIASGTPFFESVSSLARGQISRSPAASTTGDPFQLSENREFLSHLHISFDFTFDFTSL